MSKSQSKSKNPFHLLANPPLPCRIFKLKLHDISISPSRLIPSMKKAVLREIRSVSSPIIACHVEKSLRIE